MYMLTEKRYKDTLHHTPCRDTCVANQEALAEDARIREKGRRLKHTYLEAGKKVSNTNVSSCIKSCKEFYEVMQLSLQFGWKGIWLQPLRAMRYRAACVSRQSL